VFEDSSFLLTVYGKIYSWGRNDHGFLGREAKIDIKSLAFNDKRKRLAFSTFTPGKVVKLDKYPIKRIKVIDGKFYAYLID
jgi:alpha-tubulin suppressor-like RCC1 family protein